MEPPNNMYIQCEMIPCSGSREVGLQSVDASAGGNPLAQVPFRRVTKIVDEFSISIKYSH